MTKLEYLKKNIKNIAWIALTVLLALILLGLVIATIIRANADDDDFGGSHKPTPTPGKLFGGYVKEEIKIDTKIIEDRLQEMGVLITQEYNFTQVETYTDKKTLIFGITSTARLTFSYEGEVTAGIDCTKIDVERNDADKTLVVYIPKAEIQNIDIDFNSFKVYEEQNGFANKLTVADYNLAMVEFKEKARASAIERGVINKADASAKNMLLKLIKSVLPDNEYSIVFKER